MWQVRRMKKNCIAVLAETLLNLFKNQGAEIIEVDVLQPADPFLDIVGEDLRRRIFMTEDESGASLCLRPEFTIPVCIKYLNEGNRIAKLYGYCGEVFRQRRNTAPAFYQAGIEDLGDNDEARSDARSLSSAVLTLKAIGHHRSLDIVLGDQAVFEAVLAALGLPRGWQLKLLRCFGEGEKMFELIERLAKPRPIAPLKDSLKTYIMTNDFQSLVAAIDLEMRQAAISPSAGRTPEEIARRLLEKQRLSDIHLEQQQIAILMEFLKIEGSLYDAERALGRFAAANNINIDAVLQQFGRRKVEMMRIGLNLKDIEYQAAFGRKLDYYTGLVYEIRHKDALIAGGGRYNRLMTMLEAKTPIPAVGFSIWVDRLSQLADKKE